MYALHIIAVIILFIMILVNSQTHHLCSLLSNTDISVTVSLPSIMGMMPTNSILFVCFKVQEKKPFSEIIIIIMGN